MQQVSYYGKPFGKWEPAPRHCLLIPGLPNEIAYTVLARVPRAFHGRLRYVCRAWRDALHPPISPVISPRQALGISEEWVVFVGSDAGAIVFFDPVLCRFSKCLRLHKPLVGSFVDVFGTPDNQLLLLESVYCGDSFRQFDMVRMQWHRKSYYFPMVISKPLYVGWIVVGDHLYVVGGENPNDREALRRVERYNIMTHAWDRIPHMHEGRARAAVVPLQGRLCVIGGQDYSCQTKIYSGEIWDEEAQEWILEPGLWPRDVFSNLMPIVAAVMGKIYALQSTKKEFLSYDHVSRMWVSLGPIPLANFPCRQCGDFENSYCKWFLGVRNELWMFFKCSRRPDCRYRIVSCVPASQSLAVSWRVLPISMKFDKVSTVNV